MVEGRIAKVKIDGSRMEVVILSKVDTTEKETKIKTVADPHADLVRAFEALLPFALDILELPKRQWGDRAKITGVSWSFSETTGVGGACMTGIASLENCNSPFCFNTPHLPYGQYSPGGDQPTMPDKAIEALDALNQEIWKFLDGKRANDLFQHAEEKATAREEETVG